MRTAGKIRVLVVDDSAFNRRTIIKILEAVPQVEIVGYAVDGEDGLRKVYDLKPDLITLDLEMPKIDGFTFLRIVMQNRPTPVIVISSQGEDENVFKALELGAFEFVAKPTARSDAQLFNIRDDLVHKVLAALRADMDKISLRSEGLLKAQPRDPLRRSALRPDVRTGYPQGLVLIGSSTGGPPAVQSVLSQIPGNTPLMFAVSQHMPAEFTRAFAERLDRYCDLEVCEAKTGDLFKPGRVLVAPGGKNLLFRRGASGLVAHLADPDPAQRYVPSVDAMFLSAVQVCDQRLIAVVLTGMGNDGAAGVKAIKGHGGRAIAEAEDSCVVFGMPKEAIATGMIDAVVALDGIGAEILRHPT